jgi:hypothetical protein
MHDSMMIADVEHNADDHQNNIVRLQNYREAVKQIADIFHFISPGRRR